jgi:hypothetical protein
VAASSAAGRSRHDHRRALGPGPRLRPGAADVEQLAGDVSTGAPSILEAQAITPDCRSSRGVDGAWDEAVSRLREIYDAQTEHDHGVTLSLAIFRGDFQ